MIDPYRESDGLWIPPVPVAHRDEEYDSRGFDILVRMQRDHFWYRGRHRFLLHAIRRHLARFAPEAERFRIIDLGGGCGGWLSYLWQHKFPVAELALADSSETALRHAALHLPESVVLYQVDLLRLQWESRWDLAFLLDVLEHIPQQEEALRQIHEAMAPGGLLFVTVPALEVFWTWNDEFAHHQRRYRRSDFRRLADACGYQLLDARYFLFFLSPLLLASRIAAGIQFRVSSSSEEWRRHLMEMMHKVPHPIVNSVLTAAFRCETPLGHFN